MLLYIAPNQITIYAITQSLCYVTNPKLKSPTVTLVGIPVLAIVPHHLRKNELVLFYGQWSVLASKNVLAAKRHHP